MRKLYVSVLWVVGWIATLTEATIIYGKPRGLRLQSSTDELLRRAETVYAPFGGFGQEQQDGDLAVVVTGGYKVSDHGVGHEIGSHPSVHGLHGHGHHGHAIGIGHAAPIGHAHGHGVPVISQAHGYGIQGHGIQGHGIQGHGIQGHVHGHGHGHHLHRHHHAPYAYPQGIFKSHGYGHHVPSHGLLGHPRLHAPVGHGHGYHNLGHAHGGFKPLIAHGYGISHQAQHHGHGHGLHQHAPHHGHHGHHLQHAPRHPGLLGLGQGHGILGRRYGGFLG